MRRRKRGVRTSATTAKLPLGLAVARRVALAAVVDTRTPGETARLADAVDRSRAFCWQLGECHGRGEGEQNEREAHLDGCQASVLKMLSDKIVQREEDGLFKYLDLGRR
jgi:hypothetical protein